MKMQSDRITEASKLLSGIPLFSDLSENTRDLVARTSKFQYFEKGRILFFQSDPSEWAYIVRSGSVSIVLSNPDGRDMVINEMRPGDIFGELGILTAQPRSTSAIARTDSNLLVIPSQTFLRVLDSEPQLARRILQITAERLQTSGRREGALAFLDAQARLARLLLELEVPGNRERLRHYLPGGTGTSYGLDTPDSGKSARQMAARWLADHRTWTHPHLESKSSGRFGKQFAGLMRYVAKVTDRPTTKLYINNNNIQKINRR